MVLKTLSWKYAQIYEGVTFHVSYLFGFQPDIAIAVRIHRVRHDSQYRIKQLTTNPYIVLLYAYSVDNNRQAASLTPVICVIHDHERPIIWQGVPGSLSPKCIHRTSRMFTCFSLHHSPHLAGISSFHVNKLDFNQDNHYLVIFPVFQFNEAKHHWRTSNAILCLLLNIKTIIISNYLRSQYMLV